MDNSRIPKKLLDEKFCVRRSMTWPRWDNSIRRDSLLLLNTREWRTLEGDGDIWGRTVGEAGVWRGPSHQWRRKLSACILRTLSEYKVGGAYNQFTVQTTAKVSLMTVDMNTKLTTVLNAGNSVLRLRTWDHWNWISIKENVELSNIKWGIHCNWHNSTYRIFRPITRT